jgi:outer membrane putative beta-barrel porin/alpha-amylase
MDRAPLVLVACLLLVNTAARAAHPLISEDTGTQGKNRWQLELNGERYRDRVDEDTVNGKQAAAVLSYGFAENADLQVGLPYRDDGTERGISDASIDVKWRFYENGPFSLGLKPGITLPTGDDRRGLGAGSATWGSYLILSYDRDHWALHSHAGYRRNRNTLGERQDLLHWSAAIFLKPTEALKLVFDLSFDTNPDPASDATLRQHVIGLIWSLTKDFDLDAGIRRGNAPAIDRAYLLGITLRW